MTPTAFNTLVTLAESPYLGRDVDGQWGRSAWVQNRDAPIRELLAGGYIEKLAGSLVLTPSGSKEILDRQPVFRAGQVVFILRPLHYGLSQSQVILPVGEIVGPADPGTFPLLMYRLRLAPQPNTKAVYRVAALHLREATEAEAAMFRSRREPPRRRPRPY